ncbi:hypothetical protein ACFL40_02945 [candidate division KSB1 bacterium]
MPSEAKALLPSIPQIRDRLNEEVWFAIYEVRISYPGQNASIFSFGCFLYVFLSINIK